MAKYIDADELRHRLALVWSIDVAQKIVDNMPAADVVEVRHGRWEIKLDKNRLFYECKCSVCGHIESFDPKFRFFNYCPNCGASMEGEQE